MYIIMPNKLPNIQNTYPYPINNKAKARAKENHNLVVAMQLLGIAPHAHIQPHTPKPKRPRAYNVRALETTKKPRPAPGAWKGTTKNIGENFLKANGTSFRTIDHQALNIEKKLKKLRRRKTATSRAILGGNVNKLRKAFEPNKNQNPNVRPHVNSKRLPPNILKLFEGAAPVPINTSRSSRNRPGSSRVVLTTR